jgi:hypothetical protein
VGRVVAKVLPPVYFDSWQESRAADPPHPLAAHRVSPDVRGLHPSKLVFVRPR